LDGNVVHHQMLPRLSLRDIPEVVAFMGPKNQGRDPSRACAGQQRSLWVRGIAVPTVDDFETPLGRTPIDASALAKIVDLPFVLRNDAPHAPEHALEVELPFLQMLLSTFRIVPLIVGDAATRFAVRRDLTSGRAWSRIISRRASPAQS